MRYGVFIAQILPFIWVFLSLLLFMLFAQLGDDKASKGFVFARFMLCVELRWLEAYVRRIIFKNICRGIPII